MEVASKYASIGDEVMHDFLLGQPEESGQPRYVADILKHPESAWIINAQIPDEPTLYGPASGQTLPVAAYLMYPSSAERPQNSYRFPYHDSRYGVFDDMLAAGELPGFADPNERYPLIIHAHGKSAHGIFDIEHAQNLASHGYIVAVIFYGDERTAIVDDPSMHLYFLRPLLTKLVLDSILEDEVFGAHIDTDNIGISGHSMGGFTALAVTGGAFMGNAATVSDKRIKANAIAAPWVGGNYDGNDIFAFGDQNRELNQVSIPTICFFGTKDDVTLASFILPATKQLSGPTYVVELVDQPHVFEDRSWEDRNNWELLFFSAYLKHDQASLAKLKTARSIQDGNDNVQLFDYQQ